jgi:hypothetical protein
MPEGIPWYKSSAVKGGPGWRRKALEENTYIVPENGEMGHGSKSQRTGISLAPLVKARRIGMTP